MNLIDELFKLHSGYMYSNGEEEFPVCNECEVPIEECKTRNIVDAWTAEVLNSRHENVDGNRATDRNDENDVQHDDSSGGGSEPPLFETLENGSTQRPDQSSSTTTTVEPPVSLTREVIDELYIYE